MFARSLAVVGISLGAWTALLACGGSTATNATVDGSAGEGGGAGGGSGASDGGGGAGDDADAGATDGGSSGFDDVVAPCLVDAAYPPGVGPTFACGASACYAGSTYCFSAAGGAKRGPSVIGCEPFLACGPECVDAAPSCACTAYAGSGACTCTDDAGEVFVTCSFP